MIISRRASIILRGGEMQRLFTTFAGGFPGIGLLIQRLLVGGIVTSLGWYHLPMPMLNASNTPYLIADLAGAFIVLGLWTPVAGIAMAAAQVWLMPSRSGSLTIEIAVAVIGLTLALIGPGHWSVDARIFGRRHIQTVRG